MITLAGIVVFMLVAQNTGTPAAPATVDGVVTSIASGESISRAVVELRRVQIGTSPNLVIRPPAGVPLSAVVLPPALLTFTTKPDGRFEFSNVPPGDYRLYVTRESGYIPGEYGQRSPVGTGTVLTLTAGQKLSGVRLSMAPTGSISGRVVDREGDPVIYARVDLLRSAYQEGKRIFVIAQIATSDDHGDYRFYSLPPGKYYVDARPWDNRSRQWSPETETTLAPNRFASQQIANTPLVIRRTLESGDVVDETWMPIYFPSTRDGSSAQPIPLHMGESVHGIDINIASGAVPARRVGGVVIDGSTGRPAAAAMVRLLPRDRLTPSLVIPNGVTDENGRFDIQGALSTSYSLFVSGKVTSYMVVDVGSRDVEGLQIVTTNGVDVPWHATFDEGLDDATATSRLRFTLIRDPDVVGPPSEATTATAGFAGVPETRVTPRVEPGVSGGFVLRGISLGDYQVRITGLPRDTYVKSMVQGRTDVLADGLHITGVPENRIEIVLARNAGALSGRVVNDKLEPQPNVRVVLVPVRLRSRVDLYQNVFTDAGGKFTFAGIPPDQYKLFAWEEVEDGAWHDSEFMRAHDANGVSVDVRPGGSASTVVDVKVIPWKDTP